MVTAADLLPVPPRPRYVRVLLAASVLVSALFFAAAVWHDHERLRAEGHATVERAAALASEHALKIAETNLLALDRIEDRVRGLDWAAILEQQMAVHQDLRAIDEQIEQISALHLVTPGGRIAAVSTVFPAPAASIADRQYFRRHAAGEIGPLFGDPIVSRISGEVGFTMSRRRTGPDGAFDGIVFGSFLPKYFERHWETLAAGADLHLGLLRADGRVLAHLPAAPSTDSALPTGTAMMQAIARSDSGILATHWWLDGTERLVAFSRVGPYPLYVASALSLPAIRREWLGNLAVLAVFSTLAALCLSSLALRVGRRWQLEQEAFIRRLATHDALTELPNRILFRDRLCRMLADVRTGDGLIALLMIDLDRFKPVNDLHGHAAGDAVLRATALRLRAAVREGIDIVGRFGGDEFVIAVRVKQDEEARQLAQRIVVTLEEPISLGDATVQVGGSVGVALTPLGGSLRETDVEAEALGRRADAALYSAKASGRSRCCLFELGMDAARREQAALEADLRQAVLRGEIEPYFQPMVDLASKRVTGFEMLARWFHATRGEVPPCVFIPVADTAGLIGPLTEWLLRKACMIAAHWPDDITLSCNIAPGQLRDRTLPAMVRVALIDSGLSPRRLEIELTESALVQDFTLACEVLGDLRALGVRLSLDDFGAGYSGLTHLQALPIDKIKIDGSFVRGLGDDGNSCKIVAAVVGLGRSLGLSIVAEGIEDASTAAALARLGCEAGQGWHFGRAVPAAAVDAILAGAGEAGPF